MFRNARYVSAPPSGQKKKPVHFFLLAAGIAAIAGGLQTATQVFAHIAGYQESLGSHFLNFYFPWSVILWAVHWHRQYPDVFMTAAGAGAVFTACAFLVIAAGKSFLNNTARPSLHLHGSARWASMKDIRDAGLLPRSRRKRQEAGVYVGGWKDRHGKFRYLRHSGPEHVLTYAPTRSGKGVGLVIPTLLSWPHSTVITDLKGELWALTAGWRQKHAGNRVLRFEPASGTGSIRWNPLEEIRTGTEYETGDIQNLTQLIVDPAGKGLSSHWDKTAAALLTGVITHVLHKAQHEGTPATLAGIDFALSDPDRDIAELWMEMATCEHKNGKVHPVAASAARDMMDRPDDEAGSVLSTAKSYLALYRDPVVARNTGKCDFRIRDLMHHKDPVSLYIVTQPVDKGRLRPLVRILLNMVIRLLADSMSFENGRPVARYNYRLLMMLDEFPSLGKLEVIQESLAFIAGYGIKCYLICQDINQLRSREAGYGPDETITSNCHVQNAYPPNRIETADHLSRMSGQTTVVKEQVSTSGKRAGLMLGQVSKSVQEVQRPLLTPDECLRMPGPRKNARGDIEEAGDMVVYVAGYPAIYGKQPLYFKDPVFLKRALVQAPAKSDQVRKDKEENAVRL